MNDTIAAVATAHGVGAISIIRLSGADALSLALKLTKITSLVPRYATLTKIYAEGELIDEALLIYFKAPHSFTGEDVVEFQLHGGLVVANLILGELIKNGARLARAGEFSKRALINGKMDFSKIEAINSLINAKSEDSVKIIARTMRGDLAKFANEIRSELVKTLAFVETSIDYADDDLPADLLESISQMLKQNSVKLDKIVAISQSRKGLLEGFKIAIVGKPNVGKSSILNSLLSFDRAIISDEAGTTRDSIEEALKIGTHLVRIIDTAGIRKNADKIEQIGISYSLRAIEEADVILAVFDASQEADEQDSEILELLKNSQKKIFYVLNKCDLGVKFASPENPIKICAKQGTGEVINSLKTYLDAQETSEILLNSTRQISCCEAASEAIKRALNLLAESELELFAYELNTAIEQISSITKPFERSEILDEMFSNFCLGK